MPKTIDGIATLCFLEDGSYFHGILITSEKKQYGLIGKTTDAPKGSYHECCFDEEPHFVNITVIDHERKKENFIKNVMKLRGDNCTLSCETLQYDTEEMYIDTKAESYIGKYFNKSFLGRNCYVCVGAMTIHHSKSEIEEEEDDDDDDAFEF
ncbi:uncharacterized protein LOC144446983 [Glandiceps talaboti]